MATSTRTARRRPTGGSTDAGIMTLEQFLTTTSALTTTQRVRLIEQATVLLGQCYVHLPLKRAMHAVDPLQRLRLLQLRHAPMSDRQFHDELISIFTELRDLHTNYILPNPYQSMTAFLPFLIEEHFTGSGAKATRKYLVTKVAAGITEPTFKAGIELTSWSGVPIDRAVEINADRQAGSNPDARRARGLEALTMRPMMMSAPPDEHWVAIGYLDGTTERELRLPWQVFQPPPAPNASAPGNAKRAAARLLGIDATTEAVRRTKKVLFNPSAMVLERAAGAIAAGKTRTKVPMVADPATQSTMPDNLSFRSVTTTKGTFGYLRVWSFDLNDDGPFLDEVTRILGLLPQNGLILDMRGNGGGLVTASEGLLQLLTPHQVQPSLFSFIATPLTVAICAHPSLAEWKPSLVRSVETAEQHSQGFPITTPEDANRRGQQYQGPVVLITDALCYSATDIFAAGFQDNGVGTILGVSGNTGAGGANVWTHELLSQIVTGAGSPFAPLPKGADFRVAIRRVTRVGPSNGVPLEDLGVVPDAQHRMTRNDLLNGNQDLFEAAGAILAKQPLRRIDATLGGTTANRTLSITGKGVDRADVIVDGRPRASVDLATASVSVPLGNLGAGHHRVEVLGFHTGTVAARSSLTT